MHPLDVKIVTDLRLLAVCCTERDGRAFPILDGLPAVFVEARNVSTARRF